MMRLFLIGLGLLMAGMSFAVDANDVPTFKLRFRLVEKDGSAPAADAKHRFYISGLSAGVSARGSEWSEDLAYDIDGVVKSLRLYPNLYLKRYPVVLHLRTLPASTDMKVEVQLRWLKTGLPEAPGGDIAGPALELDEQKPDKVFAAHLFGERLGLLAWREADGTPMVETMVQYNRRLWEPLAQVPNDGSTRPKKFPIVDRFIGGDTDRADWKEGIQNLSRAGFSSLMVPAGKAKREVLLSTGLRRTAGAVYNPPGYAFDHEGIDQAAIDAWAKKQADPFLESGYDGADMALYAMSDEPGWYFPSRFKQVIDNPEILSRFHKYLEAQGLQPADVGSPSWEGVLPLGRNQAISLEQKRLFYWTTRFYAWDSSRHFARSTRALEEAFGAPVPVFVNWNFFSGRYWFPGPFGNNPDKESPDSAMGCHDWFEFARMRGCTMLWTEDWFGDNRAWQWSYYASKLNSCARLGNVEFGGYVIPRTAGQREGGIQQKIMTIIGHGGKAIKYFVFGPEYNFPGNCFSPHSELLVPMSEAHGMIASAEDVLWPGRRPAADVAILQPRSAMAWDPYDPKQPIVDATNTGLERRTTGYMSEVFGLYLALQHANIPVDWVDEEGLNREELAGIKVLYITTPALPAELVEPLLTWISEGGTLVTTSGALTRDRYDEPMGTFWEKVGTEVAARPRLLVPDARKLPVVSEEANFKAVGVVDGDRTAVVTKPLGEGRVMYLSWLPGNSYWASQGAAIDGLPGNFNGAIREVITAPVAIAGASSPVVVSQPLVEGPLLLSDAGAAVTLLNWTGEAIDALEVRVKLPFVPRSVRGVQAGKLTFQQDAEGWVVVTLPVGAVEVLDIRK